MIGSLFRAAGSVFGGMRANAAAKARARQLRNDAQEKRREGSAQAAAITRQARQAEARGVVAAASSGFTVAGSALDVLADMAGEYDASARNAVRNGRFAAMRLRNEAAVTRYNGRTALAEGVVTAGAHIGDAASQAMTRKGG